MTAVTPIDPPIWRNGAFVRLWTAQAVTQTAQNAIWYALLVMVEETSHSSTQLSITILSVVVPSVLFGIPAGVYVDRWDKRQVLVVTNLLRCLIVLLYIPLGSTLALVYVVSFAFSVISQFFAPAETAMIPAIVGRTRLMQANSFFHLTFTASQLVGLVLFGPLIIKLTGLTPFFVSMAVLYGVSGLLVWPLPKERREVEQAEPGRARPVQELVQQLGEVWGMLLADREMLWAMGYLTLAGTLTLVVAMLAPGFAVAVLGIAAADAVFVMAPAGLGILVAATVLSRTGASSLDRGRVITAGLVVVALALTFVAALPEGGRVVGVLAPEGQSLGLLEARHAILIGGVMVGTLFAGLGFAAVLVAAQTLLQERAPTEARGRIFAVQFAMGNLFSMLPLVLIGGIADLIGVTRVMVVIALGVLGVALVSYRRVLRRSRGALA